MKSNIDDHENGLVWTALSQTFQDAITVTQELGLRYLWIDSICIIQDDSEDWETQAAQMATVYSNARVVLAATDAKDGRGGLLFRSPYQPAKGPFTRMTGTGKFCNVYAVVRAKMLTHRDFRLQYDNAIRQDYPLLRRAWTFQKELLATRIVHFTRYEMISNTLIN
jgi:hypothetical protein